MASKIQLRRDLAASWATINPTLAQGEPGVEIDTGKMKIGDGTSTWYQLPYSGSSDYEDKFVFLFSNSNRYAAGTSTSRDGLHWTGVDATSEFWDGNYDSTYAYDLAVGNGRVAYLAYNYIVDRDVVLFSETPGSSIVDPNYTRFLEEQGANAQRSWVSSQDFYEYEANDYQNQNWVTMYGPNGEGINWHRIKFEGGYFIAIGSYYDSSINDDRNRPYFAYSQDAVHWTRGSLDLTFITGKMNAFADAYSSENYAIKDVNYNGSGWLFSMHYEWNTVNNNDMTGAFYLTDLANGFNSTTYFAMQGAYSMNFDGVGWGGYMGNGRLLFSSETDPRLGGWREVTLANAQNSVWGDNASTNYTQGSRSLVGGPLADGTPMFIFTFSNGRVLTTTDQGQYFSGSTPAAKVDSIYDWNNQSPAEIFTNNENNSGATGIQQVVITGSLNGQADGTFYAQQYDDNSYKLYYDYALTNPVNATGWTNSNLFNNAYITFTQQGIGLTIPAYGGGKFVAFSGDNANNYMTEDGVNWKYGFGWGIVYNNGSGLESYVIAYGRVGTDGQIVVNDETFPGGANSLTLGNNFDVQVNSGSPLSAYTSGGGGDYSDGTGYLSIRPYNAQWRIGAYGRQPNGPGPEPYSFIGSDDYFDYFDGPDYNNEPAAFPGGGDIRLTTWNDEWYFTANPYLNLGSTTNNQLITPDDADIVTLEQESFLKDIPRNNQNNGTAYTLTWGDRGRFIWFDGTQYPTQPVLTIPAEADVNFPIGTRIQMVISGTTNNGAWILVTPASGVTLRGREDNNSPGAGTLIVRSDVLATLIKVDTNFWILSAPYITD